MIIDKFQLVQMKDDEGIGLRGIAASANDLYGMNFERMEDMVYFLCDKYKLGVGNYHLSFTRTDGRLQSCSFTVTYAGWQFQVDAAALCQKAFSISAKMLSCYVFFHRDGIEQGKFEINSLREYEVDAICFMAGNMDGVDVSVFVSGQTYKVKFHREITFHCNIIT